MTKIEIKVPDWLDKICTWPVMVYRKQKYGYSYHKIYLGEGEFTIVEPHDYYAYGKFKWFLLGTGFNLYAVREVKIGPKKTKRVYLHREIMKQGKGKLVDHKNNNSLDNRRANMCPATHSQNSCNSRRDKSKTSSQFRGVISEKRSGLWLPRIKHHGRLIYLGRYKTEIEAARAYDAAARKYHGEFARLNFPDNTPFAVENSKSKIENRASIIRHCLTIVCYFLLAMLIVFDAHRRTGQGFHGVMIWQRQSWL